MNVKGARNLGMFTVSLTPASTAAAVVAEQAFTVTAGSNSSTLPAGVTLAATDYVSVSGPASGNSAGMGTSRINSTGQLVINFVNPTAGALTHAAGTFVVQVSRP
jgi:hypothetical protein